MENELTPVGSAFRTMAVVTAGTGPSNTAVSLVSAQKVAQDSLSSHRNSHR